MMTVQQAFELALEHHKAGHLAEAEVLYRQILATQPKHFDALQNLGVLACQVGRHDLAVDWLRRAIAIDPQNAAAHSNLGEACRVLGRLDEAINYYHRALALKPDYPEAHNNLGNALCEANQCEAALAACRRALELRPDFPDALNNLGTVLTQLGRLDEAVEACRRALQLQPDFADAGVNLGTALCKRGQFGEAVIAYRRALQSKANHVDAHNNLSVALVQQGQLDEAVTEIRRALQLQPNFVEAWSNLAAALCKQGLLDESLAAFRHALELKPGDSQVHSDLILTLLLHPSCEQAMIDEEQRRWERQFGEPAKRFIRPHANNRDPERRLRIGYVSPDLREHVVGRNVMPLITRHNSRNFEILVYSAVLRTDSLTEIIRGSSHQWRNIVGVTDETLAEMIRNDGVDILVDLSQHTAGNRLPVFARKPAPVQVSFAGYPGSTGVEAIAHRISDRYLEGNVEAAAGSEEVHVIDSFWCYEPNGIKVEINELPARECGHVTFGNLGSFSKVNEVVLRIWTRTLKRVKDSRMIILCALGNQRQRTVEFFAREGINADRVEFVGPRPHRAYLELYRRLDIVLDSFPYNGHTTNLDALWVGIPVVSLAGETAVSRGGKSILTNIGLPGLVALSEDEYVENATRLACDFVLLAELRATLRARMEASVLMDAARFTRTIEEAYRAMWRQWCAGTTGE